MALAYVSAQAVFSHNNPETLAINKEIYRGFSNQLIERDQTLTKPTEVSSGLQPRTNISAKASDLLPESNSNGWFKN